MKAFWIVAAVIVVAVLVIAGPTVERAVNDKAPAPGALGGTVLIDRGGAFATPDPAQRRALGRDLVIAEPLRVKVPQGDVMLGTGVSVELIADRGDQVEVLVGGKGGNRVNVPRRSVLNRGERLVPTEGSQPVRQSFMEKLLRAPVSSLAVDAREVKDGGSRSLRVTVRNLSRRESGECEVAVCWLVDTRSESSRRIQRIESFPVKVQGSGSAEVAATVPRGADGWIVLVRRGADLLVGLGCDPTTNEILRQPARLGVLLRTAANVAEK